LELELLLLRIVLTALHLLLLLNLRVVLTAQLLLLLLVPPSVAGPRC